jgi:hypothetical protein
LKKELEELKKKGTQKKSSNSRKSTRKSSKNKGTDSTKTTDKKATDKNATDNKQATSKPVNEPEKTNKNLRVARTPKAPKVIGGTSEGTVVVKTGGKVQLFNKGNKKNYGVGKVPVGNYTLKVDFGFGYNPLLDFTTTAGSVVQIDCNDDFMTCKRIK